MAGEVGARGPDLGSYVSSLANAVYKGITRVMAPYDLSPVDVQLMMICRERGEATASQLAQLLPVDASRVSRLVTDLVEKGLLRRRRLRRDRRVVMLKLTPSGQKVIGEATEELDAYYAKLTEGLSERQFRAFATASMKVAANYAAMEESGGGGGE